MTLIHKNIITWINLEKDFSWFFVVSDFKYIISIIKILIIVFASRRRKVKLSYSEIRNSYFYQYSLKTNTAFDELLT